MFTIMHRATILVIFLGVAVFGGCGGGGSEAQSGINLPSRTLSWAPPTSFANNIPLNPLTDLDSFEIYLKESSSFSESDLPVAQVGAVNPSTGQGVTSFNLANLIPYITPGIQYHIALRAVAITGDKSGFSETTIFSY